MYVKDLQNQVPLYGQEQDWWCGPACAQIARNGYPDPANRLFVPQSQLWDSIMANNSATTSDGHADMGWATDPQGLAACLQDASNPPGVNWTVFADQNSYKVLFALLNWMDEGGFPVPTLMNGSHWIVVVGWQTDVKPVAGSTPVLQSLDYYDPQPDDVGTYTHAVPSQWVLPAGPTEAGPWEHAVKKVGTWANDYVAIMGPPMAEGAVDVNPAVRTGDDLLTPAQATAAAERAIREQRLAANPRLGLLGHPGAQRLAPLLVREEPLARVERARSATPSRTTQTPHYYIVPFGLSHERSRLGHSLVRVCVLVNAYSGAFEQATAFGKPLSHVTEQEALAVVAAALHIAPTELADVEATLLFQPSAVTHVRALPFWRVRVGSRTLYVDQSRNLHSELRPSIAGA